MAESARWCAANRKFAWCLWLAVVAQVQAQTGTGGPFFRPVPDEAFLGSRYIARSTAIGDVDNDGWADVVVARNGGPPWRVTVWRSQEGRRFAVQPELDMPVGTGGGTILGDYDNDGDLDLYVALGLYSKESASRNPLLRNEKGVFVDIGVPGLEAELSTDNAVWLDYDSDGYLDLYVTDQGLLLGGNDPSRRNRLFRNRGDGTFEDVTAAVGLDLSLDPDGGGSNGGMAAADFNGDGRVDIYVGVYTKPNRLFLQREDGTFADASRGDIPDPGMAFGVAVGDVNGDGLPDIVQAGGGDLEGIAYHTPVLLNLGGGSFVDVAEVSGLASLSTVNILGLGLGDVDNDGDLDLLTAWPHFLFLNDGAGSFTDATAASGISPELEPSITVSFGDLDNDGFLDVVSGGVGKGWLAFLNNGSDNHYLRVELVGQQSNRNGIGARVVARSGDLRQTRWVLGGLGYYQDEMVAHLGLGPRQRVDRLEVHWPSGQVDVLEDVPADQKIRVFEGRPGYHVVERSTWATHVPEVLVAGRDRTLSLAVRPALYEPQARITRVVADLSELGGAAQVPLSPAGDGRFELPAQPIDPQVGPQQVHVLVEQETFLGPHWIRLTAGLLVAPAQDQPVFAAGLEGGWSLGPPGSGQPQLGFISNRDGVYSLEVIAADGTSRVRLTHAQRDLVDPAEFGAWRPRWDWSPDGRQAAMAANLDGRRAIWVVGVDGTGLRRLTDPPEGTQDSDPAWSPDGTRIAFTSDRSGDPEIYVTDLEGRQVQRLTSSPGVDETPAWSSDGRRLAFSSQRDLDQGEGRGEIYVMDADGGNPVRLTHSPDDDAQPAWSPDGSRIAFLAEGDPFDFVVYVIDADGGNPTQIPDLVWGFTPSWSPDGSRIAFQQFFDIVTVRPDGSDFVKVTSTGQWQEAIPRWLPAGAPSPVQVLNEPFATAPFQGRPARPLAADRVWLTTYLPPAPVEPAGYQALAFAFHPGDAQLPEGGWLKARVNDVQVDLLDGSLDVAGRQWQEVAVPLTAFRLDRPIEQIELSGLLRGTFHLADLRLVTAAHGVGTAVVEEPSEGLPAAFDLGQNYPNPFNAGTVIHYALPRGGEVRLEVYDMLGQGVATLISGVRPAGSYTLHWDGTDDSGRPLASGVYPYRLRAGQRVTTRKLVILR